jgi:hypothetical protein
MKNKLIIILFILFAFTSVALADPPQGRGYNKSRGDGYGQSYKGHPDNYHDYQGRPGYRPEPYNRGPHSGYYNRYPNYRYNGHWNSWDNWNSYYSRYPQFRNHGHYERYNGQLYFFFNDGLNAFGFSIGGAW